MRFRKTYGQSRIENCPFCQKPGVVKNSQGISVCVKHQKEILKDLKCVCGQKVEIRHGKYGVFFNCINCGNLNLRKILEINPIKKEKKEITVTSDEVDFLKY